MQEKSEKLLEAAYKRWKLTLKEPTGLHPDEETLVCFLEDRLSQEEAQQLKLHLISCNACAEIFALQLKVREDGNLEVPLELIERVKGLVRQEDAPAILEIALKLKEKMLELLATNGDVLVGQELVPAPVLRSRRIKDFKDEVFILKDFKDIRVEIKLENKPAAEAFSLTVVVKEKPALESIKDLRISLLKGDLELESYHIDSGKVTFEHVIYGKYTVDVSGPEDKLASILLDIKK